MRLFLVVGHLRLCMILYSEGRTVAVQSTLMWEHGNNVRNPPQCALSGKEDTFNLFKLYLTWHITQYSPNIHFNSTLEWLK